MSNRDVSAINRLRLVGVLEGVSFLVLLGVAMPLKYLAGMPEMVRVVGWAHGLLFVVFLAAVAPVARRLRWSYDQTAGAVGAALLPFGTFVLDRRLRRAIDDVRDRQALVSRSAAG